MRTRFIGKGAQLCVRASKGVKCFDVNQESRRLFNVFVGSALVCLALSAAEKRQVVSEFMSQGIDVNVEEMQL